MHNRSHGAALDDLLTLEQRYRDLLSDPELAPGEAERIIALERAANPHLRDRAAVPEFAPAPELDRDWH